MKQEENFKLFDFFVTLLIKIKHWNKHFCIRTKNVSKDSHQQLSKVKGQNRQQNTINSSTSINCNQEFVSKKMIIIFYANDHPNWFIPEQFNKNNDNKNDDDDDHYGEYQQQHSKLLYNFNNNDKQNDEKIDYCGQKLNIISNDVNKKSLIFVTKLINIDDHHDCNHTIINDNNNNINGSSIRYDQKKSTTITSNILTTLSKLYNEFYNDIHHQCRIKIVTMQIITRIVQFINDDMFDLEQCLNFLHYHQNNNNKNEMRNGSKDYPKIESTQFQTAKIMTNIRSDNNNNDHDDNDNSQNKRTKNNKTKVRKKSKQTKYMNSENGNNNNGKYINNDQNMISENIIKEFSGEEKQNEQKQKHQQQKQQNNDEKWPSMTKIITYALYDEYNEINMFRIKYKLSCFFGCSFIPVANNNNNNNNFNMNNNDDDMMIMNKNDFKNIIVNNNNNDNNSYRIEKENLFINIVYDNAIRLSNENLFIQWQQQMYGEKCQPNDNNHDGQHIDLHYFESSSLLNYRYPLFKIFPEKINEMNEKILIIFDGKISDKHYGKLLLMNHNHIDVLINGQSTINWLWMQWIDSNILIVKIPDKFFVNQTRNASFSLNMAIILNGQHILGSRTIQYDNGMLSSTLAEIDNKKIETTKIKSLIKPNDELICQTFGVDTIDQVDHDLSSLFDVAISNNVLQNNNNNNNNRQWPTWFHLCAAYGLEKLLMKLMEKLTKQQLNKVLFIRNCLGLTPMDLAYQNKHSNIVNILNEFQMNNIEQNNRLLSESIMYKVNDNDNKLIKNNTIVVVMDDNNQFQPKTMTISDGNEQFNQVILTTKNYNSHYCMDDDDDDDDPIKSTKNRQSFNNNNNETVSKMDKKQFVDAKRNEPSSSSSSLQNSMRIIEKENNNENISKQQHMTNNQMISS
ncbi:Dof, BCAP, and BANK (DBB) motif [Dermatophagoides pteronyssinus]|uniref:Dof, BCAP, and BANK (DBB) motif n=1 Tax=Dermatophagoides pteronyssinus TaxID=6956 RepID=A0ABQ8JAY3_DERPT|nr:Dof, BCAP, and BANK (DBB) motif [Dermatophagoides pteronyssinus]